MQLRALRNQLIPTVAWKQLWARPILRWDELLRGRQRSAHARRTLKYIVHEPYTKMTARNGCDAALAATTDTSCYLRLPEKLSRRNTTIGAVVAATFTQILDDCANKKAFDI